MKRMARPRGTLAGPLTDNQLKGLSMTDMSVTDISDMADTIVARMALASCVLAVAVKRVDGWCAYCDAVRGHDHPMEQDEVARSGDKLPESVARAIFPRFDDIRYAH